jgi:hypothetical protein
MNPTHRNRIVAFGWTAGPFRTNTHLSPIPYPIPHPPHPRPVSPSEVIVQIFSDTNGPVTPSNPTDSAGNVVAFPPGTTFKYTVDNPIVTLTPSADTTSVNVAGTGVSGTVNLTAVATFPDKSTDTGIPLVITVVAPDPSAFTLVPGTFTVNTPVAPPTPAPASKTFTKP